MADETMAAPPPWGNGGTGSSDTQNVVTHLSLSLSLSQMGIGVDFVILIVVLCG